MHDDGSSRMSRTLSGESEFYDAADGDGEPLSPDRWVNAAAAAAAAAEAVVRKGAAAPQPGGEDTGSGEEGWRVGVSAEAATAKEGDGGGRDDDSDGDDDDSLDFQDARDPVSEVRDDCCRR